jgi:dATP pyrophosphohydrolase
MPHKIPESVLVVIHTADLEVLLIERADRPGFWQSVTGSLDRVDEPLLDTAARELFEETGIHADGETHPPARLAPVQRLRDLPDLAPPLRARRHPQHRARVFRLRAARYPDRAAPREHLQYAWLPLLEAADRCFS